MTKFPGSMYEALAPLATRLRRRRALVEPVSQVNMQIHSSNGESAFDAARKTVLEYFKRRARGDLPAEALEGRSFVLDELGSRHVEGIAIQQPRYWTVRFDDEDLTIAQRSWVIETALAEASEQEPVQFGLRLQCVSRGENPEYDRTVPTFVRNLIDRCDARLDGRRLSRDPWIIDTEEDVSLLVALLQSRHREADVVVLSLPEEASDVRHTAVPAWELVLDLAGAAHVAVITSSASFLLTDAVGREFSVFQPAVRTYRPGFDPGSDEPFAHPLGLASRIANFHGGWQGYQKFLVSDVLQRTVERRDAKKRMPSFAEAKRTALELRRRVAKEEGSSSDDLLALAEQEIADLKDELKSIKAEHEGLLELADEERDGALEEVQRLRSQLHHLQERINSVAASSGGEAKVILPNSLDDLENWAGANLAGHVELHNRALRNAKNSKYEDVHLIYTSLLLLRDYYVPMRRYGDSDLRKAFESRCRELGIDEDSTFAGTRAGEQGDTYFIKLGGRRVMLDRHLKKGVSRDPRYCLRVYFTWDETTQQVVVGSLPAHLTTRAS